MPESTSDSTLDGKIGYFLAGRASLLLAQEAEVEVKSCTLDSTALSLEISKVDTSSEEVAAGELDFIRSDNDQYGG